MAGNNMSIPPDGFDNIKNVLRLLFKNTTGERFLQQHIIKDSQTFWKKFIPPHYLYKPGSLRSAKIKGTRFAFDISNQCDHYTFFGLEEPGYDAIKKDILE